MLQYLIILLDDTSTSFCHYENPNTKKHLISLEVLRQGIRFGMMENLMIQFVYPTYEIPQEHKDAIECIDHSKIMPRKDDADVWVTDNVDNINSDIPVVLHIGKEYLFSHEREITEALGKVSRLNIVLTDVDTFTEEDFVRYKTLLEKLSASLVQLFTEGKRPQLNLLTDRIMLSQMNNCGSGVTTITLAPNGKLYVCPAFYYEDETDCIGDLEHGVDIKNKQLYRLDHAPICSHCDSFHCKRCVWLNRKTTLEVNTPSHEQCVLAHLERNASRDLLRNIRIHGIIFPEQEGIMEIDYLDPFDKKDEW
jgi:CXXX repeat peptide maturase